MRSQVLRRASWRALEITLILFAPIAFAQSNEVAAKEFEVVEASISDIRSAIAADDVTCTEIVEQYLERIEAYNLNGPAINAVITVNPNALDEAAQLDATFAEKGFVGPLHCVTIRL